ncbi:MAG TPA: DUF1365 domain-containing protein [Bacteroidia bacterium]|nr:DUF1365 domain-containing protein [Bacteroidia bacterium]
MNSSLYTCSVMHNRLAPKKHNLHYNVFMFWLDLDEINEVAKTYWLFSRNRFNMFNFCDADHLQLPIDNPDKTKNVKQQITGYLQSQNVKLNSPKIFLLTNLRTLGYQFNPVSFYFIYENEKPVCCVAEVGNTFGEMKLFLLNSETLSKNQFLYRTKKYFYVSPFIEHDVDFDFHLSVPNDKLNLRIDDYRGEDRFFIATVTGNKKEITQLRLIWYALRFPFITLKIISLIHWNALLLWLKKIPYHKKEANPNLQREVLRKYPQSR